MDVSYPSSSVYAQDASTSSLTTSAVDGTYGDGTTYRLKDLKKEVKADEEERFGAEVLAEDKEDRHEAKRLMEMLGKEFAGYGKDEMPELIDEAEFVAALDAERHYKSGVEAPSSEDSSSQERVGSRVEQRRPKVVSEGPTR